MSNPFGSTSLKYIKTKPQNPSAKLGRPRSFDRDEAVRQALHLFWAQGYEATSLAQLKAAMGSFSTASFYAAFGSKEALFRESLRFYLATHGQVVASLGNPHLPPREAIEQALRLSARMQTDPAHPPGCLVVLSLSTGSPENRHLQRLLTQEREQNRANLQACVQRAIQAGELSAATDVAAMTTLFNTFLVGRSTQARDGASTAVLDAAISQLMGVWDALASTGRPPQS